MDWPLGILIDEILLKLEASLPRRVLFWGEEAERIASYVAGWIAHRGIPVIILDGANQFNPYAVSAFTRRMLIPAEEILKKILIARAFTCYQMITLVREKLTLCAPSNIIVMGPMNTFLDEDIRDEESRILFDRFLRTIGEMSFKAFRFFLFQSSFPQSGFFSSGWPIGEKKRLSHQRKLYFTKRLFRFSDSLWRISLVDEHLTIVRERERVKNNLTHSGYEILNSK